MELAIAMFMLTAPFVIFASNGDPLRLLAFAFLALYHFAFVFVFYNTQESTGSDAAYYYNYGSTVIADILNGTDVALFLTAVIRDTFHATFLETFYVYQFFGFVGIMLVLNVAIQAAGRLQGWRSLVLPAFALVPGLHFWTVAPGKDGLAMLGLGLICRGLALSTVRKVSVASGILVLALVRPHVAVVEMACILFATMIWSKRASAIARPAGLAIGAFATIAGAMFVLSGLGLDQAGTDELTSFVGKLEMGNQQAGSAIDVANMIYPIRMMAFLLLPFYFDARNVSAFVLSVENTLYLCLIAYVIVNAKQIWRHSRDQYAIGFACPAFILLTILLTLGSSNSGLASRQKMMVVPLLPILFAYLQSQKKKDTSAASSHDLQANVEGAALSSIRHAPR